VSIQFPVHPAHGQFVFAALHAAYQTRHSSKKQTRIR
jgi:hypothetical protein